MSGSSSPTPAAPTSARSAVRSASRHTTSATDAKCSATKESLSAKLSETDSDPVIAIAFDKDRHAPGCVLLQAALGGNSSVVGTVFDSNTWIVGGPIEGLKLYTAKLSEWRMIAAMSSAIWRGRRPDHDPVPRDWKERAKEALSCYDPSKKNHPKS